MKTIIRVTAIFLAIIMAFGSLTALAIEQKPVYVVIGDSIAAGTGLSSPGTDAYGAIVANTNGYEYINHAVPGYTTGNLLKLMKKDNVRSDLERADIISISIGGNNFLLGGMITIVFKAAVMKDYSVFDKIVADLYADFSEIIGEIKKINPDALILMQNLYTPRYDGLREAYQQGVNRLNAAFVRYLDENPGSYVLVDVEKAFNGKSELIAPDVIHPNAEGHVLISRLLLNALYEQKMGTVTEPVIAPHDKSNELNRLELLFIGIKNIFLTIRNLIGL